MNYLVTVLADKQQAEEERASDCISLHTQTLFLAQSN